jgi:hypothetical protein
MIAIVTVLVAFPAGFLLRSWLAANVTYVAAYGWAFSFQGVYLVRMWGAGDDSAFPADGGRIPVSYGLATLAIYAIGFGLVALGHRVGRRWRAGRRAA